MSDDRRRTLVEEIAYVMDRRNVGSCNVTLDFLDGDVFKFRTGGCVYKSNAAMNEPKTLGLWASIKKRFRIQPLSE